MTHDASVWLNTLVALLAVSALSLVGAAALVLRPDRLRAVLVLLIPFAAGTLLGDAFIHLLPEVSETEGGLDLAASLAVLAGVTGFFVLEKVLHWHHAHFPHEEVIHPVAVTNLMGDALHNFLDGAIVAGGFAVDFQLGVATVIAVAVHEIPQELGDFGILVHAGLPPRRALALNFGTALAGVAGGALALASASATGLVRFWVPFSAGAFVYIASTDLIPELHKEPEVGKSVVQTVALVAGVALMAALLLFE